MSILSLHHVTATVDDANDDLDFCLGALGLRLVKKTVNFDNRFVYHFYYGDQRGTPGTIWTTFPYKGRGVRVGTKGAGQVTAVAFSVPVGTLNSWRGRLGARGIAVTDVETRFGDAAVSFSDLSGLTVELIATATDDRRPWVGVGFDPGSAIRGLHSVTMTIRDLEPTLRFMTTHLEYAVVAEASGRVRVGIGGGGPGKMIDIAHDPAAGPAVNGRGTVHHVAMAVESEAEQLRFREALVAAGRTVTEVRDRCYFKSIYFREPGGVLFEIATLLPGFCVDEELASLGRQLKLPPWEEPNRAAIEAELVQLQQ